MVGKLANLARMLMVLGKKLLYENVGKCEEDWRSLYN
jgi:hypothetical protein